MPVSFAAVTSSFHHFDPTVVHRMPSYPLCEAIWASMALMCFIHASSRYDHIQKQKHILLFFCALFTGIANENIFMYLPLVDNFWHAQATFMLTNRLPLYIGFVYIVVLYVPSAYIWQLRLSHWVIPITTALLGCLFYWPFDIIGAKFIWWTWHDSDNNTIPRILGVPVASSMWMLTFQCCFSFLLNYCLNTSTHFQSSGSTRFQQRGFTTGQLFRMFLTVCILSVPMMMLHMMTIQIMVSQTLPPLLHPPNTTMLCCTLLAYVAVCIYAAATNTLCVGGAQRFSIRCSRVLTVLVLAHFSFLTAMAIFGEPTQHLSIGVHQAYGPSDVVATDWSGLSRNVYISRENMIHKDYFYILGILDDGQDWYAIQGKEKSEDWVRGVLLAICLASAGYIGFPVVTAVRNSFSQFKKNL